MDFDLDDILNSVSIEGEGDGDGEGGQSLPPTAPSDFDMDDILNDVADSLLGEGHAEGGAAAAAAGGGQAHYEDDDDELDSDLGAHLQAVDEREFLSAAARVPADVRARWTEMYGSDATAPQRPSRFRCSDSYSGGQPQQPKKVFQECVRRALKKSKVSESKIAEIIGALLSVPPAQHDAMMAAFQEQTLRVHRDEIKSDPNFADAKSEDYPSLKSYIVDTVR
jgi:hypothetical protein